MCLDCGCTCCCQPSHPKEEKRRRFLTKAERLEKLKTYAEELKTELDAVQEHIEKLEE